MPATVRLSDAFLLSLGIGPGAVPSAPDAAGANRSASAPTAAGHGASPSGSAPAAAGPAAARANRDRFRFLDAAKTAPEDFVVAEVDWCGEAVSGREGYAVPPATAPSDEVEAAARREREAKRARARQDGQDAEARMAREGVDPLAVLAPSTRAALRLLSSGPADGDCEDVTCAGGSNDPSADAIVDDADDDGATATVTLGHFPDPAVRVPLLRACAAAHRGLQMHSQGGTVTATRCPRHAALLPLIGRDNADRVAALFHAPNEEAAGARTDPVDLPPDADRAHRTAVHRVIARHYGRLLETKTVERAGKGPVISVRLKPGRQRGGRKRKRRDGDGDGDGPNDNAGSTAGTGATAPAGGATGASSCSADRMFTVFVVEKRDTDHLRALDVIAAAAGCPAFSIAVCGIKDKVGVTTQLASAPGDVRDALWRGLPRPPADADRPVTVGATALSAKPVRRGQHSGNRFSLVLHGVPAAAQGPAEAALARIGRSGFVNYFGTQRFGSEGGLAPTADVGHRLVVGDWVGACLLLLGDDPAETDPAVRAARACFSGGGDGGGGAGVDATGAPPPPAGGALRPSDVERALELMPQRRTRERALLRALHRHGVGRDGAAKAVMALPQPVRQFYVHAYSSRVFNRMAAARIAAAESAAAAAAAAAMVESDASGACGAAASLAMAGDLVSVEGVNGEPCVRVLTAAEAASGRHSLDDIVLPVLGYKSVLPPAGHPAGDVARAALAADGVELSNFRLAELGVSAKGAYRRVVARPKGLESTWEAGDDGAGTGNVRVAFELAKSCYATMLVHALGSVDVDGR